MLRTSSRANPCVPASRCSSRRQQRALRAAPQGPLIARRALLQAGGGDARIPLTRVAQQHCWERDATRRQRRTAGPAQRAAKRRCGDTPSGASSTQQRRRALRAVGATTVARPGGTRQSRWTARYSSRSTQQQHAPARGRRPEHATSCRTECRCALSVRWWGPRTATRRRQPRALRAAPWRPRHTNVRAARALRRSFDFERTLRVSVAVGPKG